MDIFPWNTLTVLNSQNTLTVKECQNALSPYTGEGRKEGRKEGNVLFNATHFIYGYMASDIW